MAQESKVRIEPWTYSNVTPPEGFSAANLSAEPDGYILLYAIHTGKYHLSVANRLSVISVTGVLKSAHTV